ncbi:hypothetical protein BASA61_008449 [Batrachochytrium salamandrivorans]|nr:hypothetical protein BASA61_008449 [Batrachochytrium salamandrivorans]
MSDHIAQVQNVLRVLQDNGLYCKAEKCHFYKSEIKYLGYIISADGLRMDPSKISAVQSWPTPKKVRDLQVLPFILETDASDYAISGVLSQYDDSNTLRPIAFYARQMNSAEQNYEIYDKELLAVVESFKHWRHFLQGGLHPCHRLVRPQELRVLHDDQEVNSSSGSLVLGIVRKVVDLQSLVADMDLHLLLHSQVLEKVFVLESDWPLIIADFLAGEDNVWMDDVPEVILERCKRELKHFRFRDNSFLRILEDGKSTAAYVTTDKRVDVMKHYHTSLAHLKYGSIIDLLLRRFWWPSMKKDLKDFIARCPECQLDRSSSGIHAPLPIRPVPPVALPFERWGIDFYGPMAETKSGNKYLITCIDYATRWVLAKPVKDMTESAVSAFLYELMMTYGAPVRNHLGSRQVFLG